ncbi:porin [Roseovarius sp. M141]|uniref:porin n=1 Tax=Roseovarius sp. M141 TaxID=2583806 RepID=UPI0020CFD36C|nr:porin [Roseovarius sp. M141]MCQ0091522.1 porin [Roseovarius sp. M141]
MKITQGRVLACALLAVPGAGLAQDFEGSATIGYDYSSVSNGRPDVNSYAMDGAGTLGFQNGFSLDLDGSFHHANPDRGSNMGVFDAGGVLNYRFVTGPVVGAYLEYASLDSNGLLGADINATSYGLTGGYEGQLLQAKLFYGGTDASAVVGATSDWTDYGLTVAYTPTQNTTVAGYWMRSDIDAPFGNTDATSFGVGADYNFGNGFSGFGGISRLNFDALNIDATSYGLGVGYDLNQVARVPAQISLELARTTIDPVGRNTDVDSIRLGVTIPLGARNTAGAPLNSAANNAMSPRHNAVSTFYDNLY